MSEGNVATTPREGNVVLGILKKRWRGWLRAIHRDVGYLAVGLTVIYALSGLAINHIKDWNPNFHTYEKTRTIAPIDPALDDDAAIALALQELGIKSTPRSTYRAGDEIHLEFDGRKITVIGDQVNVSSRLEGLTKRYQESLLISESVMKKLDGKFPCRLIDRVVPKGKSAALAIGIYVPRQELSGTEAKAWALHEEALDLYYKRHFREAAGLFRKVQGLLPEDRVAASFLERCQTYQSHPPGKDWTGAVIMTEK